MSDHPDVPGSPDPFEGLPEELRRMLQAFGGPQLFDQLQAVLGTSGGGPVNWELAGQVARQVAADGDRAPTEQERARAEEAQGLAEHWLDEGPLPAPAEAGRLVVASRQDWVAAALDGLAPLVEPVAEASTRALADLAADQLRELGGSGDVSSELDALGLGGLGGLGGLLGGLDPQALTGMLAPLGAVVTGMQAGQVIGQLARQLLGQYELGVPTAPRTHAYHLAVNVTETFEGYGLDLHEVYAVLALQEGAHRRLYQAVPWLAGHVHGLVWQFADLTELDPERLGDISRDLMSGVDPEDPEAMQEAMARAADFQLEPTPAQRRVLERLQGVVCLVQGWARHEVRRATQDRLSQLPRIEEVLRRRRASQGDGEKLLAQLLGLDLKPDDETVGDRFVAAVEETGGDELLREALAHPENLPDAEELADPERWLERIRGSAGGDEAVPDDLSELFALGDEGPHEGSADERLGASGEDEDGSDHDPDT